MAKITPGSLAGAISGALGNDVFSHNRYGPYIRRRVIPTAVYSTYTAEAKARLAAVSQGWAGLTDAQRAGWATWAASNPITDRLGFKQTLSGHAAYCKLNARLLRSGDTPIDVPPTEAAPDALLTVTGTFDIGAGNFELAFTATPLGAGTRLWIWGCVHNSPGVKYVKNLLKLISVSAAAQVSPLNIESAMAERFGTLQVGQIVTVWAHVLDGDTGLLSAPVIETGTITST